MNNFWRLDWPSLPASTNNSIINQYEFFKESAGMLTSSANNLERASYKPADRGYYHLKEWQNRDDFIQGIFANFNINTNFLDRITIQCSKGGLPPHTDHQRNLSVIYVVSGPADTVFYKHNNDQQVPHKVYNRHELTEMERVRFDLNTWYLFNNANIHGVENQFEPRISLTIDISSFFETFEQAKTAMLQGQGLFL